MFDGGTTATTTATTTTTTSTAPSAGQRRWTSSGKQEVYTGSEWVPYS